MAVNRIWFPNAPASGISKADRAQLSIGYPLSFSSSTTQVQISFEENYIRRYVNDLPKHLIIGGVTPAGGVTPVPSFTVGFAEEVPSGTIDGVNLSFTLTHNVFPTSSLLLYKDGVLQVQGTHYTLSNHLITFISPFQPDTGQDLFASYRYVA